MVVRNNLSAINTLNTLNRNHSALIKSLQTVATGMRINSAKDDASGYAISERMRVEIASLDQANRNTQNGMSMMKVAEGAVQSTVDILKTLKEKVINAANDTNTDADRMQIQKELDQSIDQINDNANLTYNGKYLVDGSKNGKSDGTYTALTNESLSEKTNGGIRLTALKDRNEQNLNIQSSDSVTVSYVQQGKTYTTTFQVGNSTLQDIFIKAEAIDGSTQTFADQTNTSVGIASGAPSSEAVIEQRTQLYNAWQASETALTNAKNAVNAQQGVVDGTQATIDSAQAAVISLTALQSAVSSTFSALSNAVTNNSDSVTYTKAGPYSTAAPTVNAAGITAGFNDWVSGGVDTSIATSPAPNQLSDNGNEEFFYAVVDGSTIGGNTYTLNNPSASITAIRSNYSNYKTAYNTYASTDYTATSGTKGYGDKALSYANADLADANSHMASEQATLASLESARDAAQVDRDTKAGAYNSMFGPFLLYGDNVGVDYAGQLQTTPDLGSAITVTANGLGVDGQISGLTISVSDSNGNIKKSVNAVLDAWTESIRGENASPEDNALVLQTGSRANQAIKIRLSDMRAQALGLQGKDGTTLNVSTQEKANAAINVLDNALQKALDQQTTIGSIESRLAYTSANLTTAIENLTASESTIRDADMAKAMTEYTKNNILMQASQAMLAQANQNNNQVLSLLR